MSNETSLKFTTHDSIVYDDKIAIIHLVRSIWPSDDGVVRSAHEELDLFFTDRPEEKHIVAMNRNLVCGYAKVFLREIFIDNVKLRNCALAGVCVKPEQRMNGLGKSIVRKAFDLVDQKQYDCAIFQTAVPEFYTKLGARILHNQCVNSQDGNSNPWWDRYVMVYPSPIQFGDAIIDLNGKGY